jgi:DNA modification methylase
VATVNQLFYGDNLRILRDSIRDESVDLIYLDPPFNSNRSYNVLFQHKSGEQAQAQIEAFGDTWTWSQESEALYEELVGGGAPAKVADAIQAMRRLLGDNDVLAYLVMMTARLVELHRVLKPTGSLYLHCDPTASHYLKVLLDAVFGPERFRNEVVWKRTGAHGAAHRFGPVHDVILFVTKSDIYTWNPQFTPYDEVYEQRFGRLDETGQPFQDVALTGPGLRGGDSGLPWRGIDPSTVGRHWQPSSAAYDAYERATGESLAAVPSMVERLDRMDAAGLIYWPRGGAGVPRFKQRLKDMPGLPAQDVITDVPPINSQAAERLGYPTQKPVALLERLIAASSNTGEVVLDPFCGCGTTIDAAHKLGRRWIGIDVTYLAIDLIEKRLRATYGDEVRRTFELRGVPKEVEAAQALFNANAFDFERWAVSLVNGEPNEKQAGDRGIDGIVRFYLNEKKETGEVLVSVKGGGQLNPGMVRDLRGTVERQGAAMGVFICMTPPTRGMIEEADHSGSYEYEFSGAKFPKIQILTVAELLHGKRPAMPTPILPYKLAKRRSGQLDLLGDI